MSKSTVGTIHSLCPKPRQYRVLEPVGLLQIKHADLVQDDENKLVITATAAGLPPGAWPDYVVVTDEQSPGQIVEKVFGPTVREEYDHELLIAKTYFPDYTNSLELRIELGPSHPIQTP